jgi:hypothetical protein
MPPPQVILDGMTGHANPASVLAMMGSSGAGKAG